MTSGKPPSTSCQNKCCYTLLLETNLIGWLPPPPFMNSSFFSPLFFMLMISLWTLLSGSSYLGLRRKLIRKPFHGRRISFCWKPAFWLGRQCLWEKKEEKIIAFNINMLVFKRWWIIMHRILLKTYILLSALLQWLALYAKLAGGKGNI